MSAASSSAYVYPKLKRTGLGNMLFLWAKAEHISRKHDLPMIAPDWVQLSRIGPWLRREKYKRYYFRDFTNSGYITGLRKQFLLRSLKTIESEILEKTISKPEHVVIAVSKDDGFRPIIDDVDYIREKLLSIISPNIRSRYELPEDEYIGVHVRRGDFIGIKQDLPNEWYVNVCNYLRKKYSVSLPIRVFSDAKSSELDEFSKLKDCSIMPTSPAVLDLLLLAKSRFIVGSSMSTFSLWASYLLRRPTFWSPISPGVRGYGLATDNHVYTDWDGWPIK